MFIKEKIKIGNTYFDLRDPEDKKYNLIE